MTTAEAVDKVVEELVLNFLGDLQKSELNGSGGTVLPSATAPPGSP